MPDMARVLDGLDRAAGEWLEKLVAAHHRRRLTRLGWAQALSPTGAGLWADGDLRETMQPVTPCATCAFGAAARNCSIAPQLVGLNVREGDPPQLLQGPHAGYFPRDQRE